MKKMIKTVGKASVLAMAVAAASTAVADDLGQLFFTQDTGWVDPQLSFDGSSGNIFQGFSNPTDGDAPANTNADMAWSGTDPAVQSSINLTGFDSNGINTTPGQLDLNFAPDLDGEWNATDWWVISTLTQTNRSLAVSSTPVPETLWETTAASNFRIFADDLHADLLKADLGSELDVEFWETLNSTRNNVDCPDSINPLTTVCDDVYRVTAADFSPISFVENGYLYSVAFALIPGPSYDAGNNLVGTSLVCLNDADAAEQGVPQDPRCAGTGVDSGEIWVFTPEYNPGTSSLSIAASWSSVQIPEPAVLGMFGIGILGMGLAGRRRKQQQA